MVIFSIGVISASENIDNISMNDGNDLIEITQKESELSMSDDHNSIEKSFGGDELLETSNRDELEASKNNDLLGKAPTFSPRIDDSPKLGNKYPILWVEDIPKNAKGVFQVSVNSKVVNTHTITDSDRQETMNEGWTLSDLKITKAGTYSLVLKFIPKNGKSKVIAKYPSWTVYKPKTIKLTLKNVNVKKSLNKLTLKSTLKINGKLAKNKKIKFKFNNKVFKAKTNKNGVVKVIIKKAIIDKLEVGKKVKYQASYGKKTVKKSVIVKQ